jgi:dinuclear metal center YbgI/SA1388 family protein
MKIAELASYLESIAPPKLAESYDNVGLLVGEPDTEITGVLINLDVTEDVIAEAVRQGCNVVVTHHPIWFTPRSRLNGEDYVSRCIISAIRNGVALYAIHTNLDNVRTGVNRVICEKLGLTGTRILQPKSATLRKLVTYVPEPDAEKVLHALWAAGAGKIGDYDQASFSHPGTGTFRPLEGADPTIGQIGTHEKVAEMRIEVVFPCNLKSMIIKALIESHPYEEVAYQVIETENSIAEIGSGMIGKLPKPLKKADFLAFVRDSFGCGGIRYSEADGLELIENVAVCGGSGSFLIGNALRAGAHALVTADVTYHKFFDPEGRMMLLDIGHWESEQFTSLLLKDLISEKFRNFAVRLSEVKTNPVKYFR